MKKKDYFGIFNSWDRIDDDIRRETREMLAECNGISVDDVSDEWVDESIIGCLDDERANLDKETGGYIIALGVMGLWYGHPTGYLEVGTNVADIFSKDYGGDDCEWYADRYNVRAKASHHDGTNLVIFRVCKDKEDAEKVCDMIYDGRIRSERDLFRRTKSLRPYVARVYGWEEYGKQKGMKI